MKYAMLMNRNVPVMKVRIDDQHQIDAIMEICNLDFAPLPIWNAYHDKSSSVLKAANLWFTNRGIPDWRVDLPDILMLLKVPDTGCLREISFSLSLSDTYWLRPNDQPYIGWEQINYFEHPFSGYSYLYAAFSPGHCYDKPILNSPNGTTDGMLPKAWIWETRKRKLVKGSACKSQQEPLNELIASEICKILHFDHCSYSLRRIGRTFACVCDCMIAPNEEMIPAADIFFSEGKPKAYLFFI